MPRIEKKSAKAKIRKKEPERKLFFLEKGWRLVCLKTIILALVVSSFFLPWYYDKAKTSVVSEVDWYLSSYRVTISDNNTVKKYSYSYTEERTRELIPNMVNVWNRTYLFMLLALASSIFLLLYALIAKIKNLKKSFLTELLVLFLLVLPLLYFWSAYPSANALDGNNVERIEENAYLWQHAEIETFSAIIRGGRGSWGPSFGFFTTLSAAVLVFFILEERFRDGIGYVFDRMVEYQREVLRGR
jgi:hypothetical protein